MRHAGVTTRCESTRIGLVATPHDLDAERIAAAFGGYTSCLELVDPVIPAVRASMGMQTRRDIYRCIGVTTEDAAIAEQYVASQATT